MLEPDVIRSVKEQNRMQGWLRQRADLFIGETFRLTKLIFLKARALLLFLLLSSGITFFQIF